MMNDLKSYFIKTYSFIKFDESSLIWDLDLPKWTDFRTYYLLLSMTLPSIIMLLFLHLFKDIWSAIALFHISCVFTSLFYMIFYRIRFRNMTKKQIESSTANEKSPLIDKNTFHDTDIIINIENKSNYANGDDYKWYHKLHQSLKPKTQYFVGILLFITSVGLGLALYYAIAGWIPNVADKIENYGLLKYKVPLYFFFIYFSVVNPFVEEWFWRIFLVNTYGSNLIDRIVITFFYMLYHFFVLIVFFNIWISVLFSIVIYVGGILFNALCKYFGPMTGVFGHMAADLIIVMIISNMYYHWYPMAHVKLYM